MLREIWSVRESERAYEIKSVVKYFTTFALPVRLLLCSRLLLCYSAVTTLLLMEIINCMFAVFPSFCVIFICSCKTHQFFKVTKIGYPPEDRPGIYPDSLPDPPSLIVVSPARLIQFKSIYLSPREVGKERDGIFVNCD